MAITEATDGYVLIRLIPFNLISKLSGAKKHGIQVVKKDQRYKLSTA